LPPQTDGYWHTTSARRCGTTWADRSAARLAAAPADNLSRLRKTPPGDAGSRCRKKREATTLIELRPPGAEARTPSESQPDVAPFGAQNFLLPALSHGSRSKPSGQVPPWTK